MNLSFAVVWLIQALTLFGWMPVNVSNPSAVRMSRDWHARRKTLAYSPVFACVGTLVSSFHEATRSQATLHPQPVAVGAALPGRTSRGGSARETTR